MLRHDNEDLGLPSAEEEEVAPEMRDMPASIHWRGGFNLRGVEFVGGGDGMTSSVTFYVTDSSRVWFPLFRAGPPFSID